MILNDFFNLPQVFEWFGRNRNQKPERNIPQEVQDLITRQRIWGFTNQPGPVQTNEPTAASSINNPIEIPSNEISFAEPEPQELDLFDIPTRIEPRSGRASADVKEAYGPPGSKSLGAGNFQNFWNFYRGKRYSENLKLEFGNDNIIEINEAGVDKLIQYYNSLDREAQRDFVYGTMSREEKLVSVLNKLEIPHSKTKFGPSGVQPSLFEKPGMRGVEEGQVIPGKFVNKQQQAADRAAAEKAQQEREWQEYVKLAISHTKKLKQLAAWWWNNDESPAIEKILARMGYEIGQDDGYDNGGVFIVAAGDENGNTYVSWPAKQLEKLREGVAEDNLNEADIDKKIETLKKKHGITKPGSYVKHDVAADGTQLYLYHHPDSGKIHHVTQHEIRKMKKEPGVAEEASPMIKPPTNRFDTKEEAFAYARQHGGKVLKQTYTDPNTGNKRVSFVVKKEQGVAEGSLNEFVLPGGSGGDNYGGDLHDILMSYISRNEPELLADFGEDEIDSVVADMVTMGMFDDIDPDNEEDLEDALDKIIDILNDDLPEQQGVAEGTMDYSIDPSITDFASISIIKKLKRDVHDKRLPADPKEIMKAGAELARYYKTELNLPLLAKQVLSGYTKGVAEGSVDHRALGKHHEEMTDQELRKVGSKLPDSWDAAVLRRKLASHPKYAKALKHYDKSEYHFGKAAKQGVAEGREELELYGLRIGDTVRASINGKRVQGDVIDIFPETQQVELLLRGANAGKTVTVDVHDTQALGEQSLAEVGAINNQSLKTVRPATADELRTGATASKSHQVGADGNVYYFLDPKLKQVGLLRNKQQGVAEGEPGDLEHELEKRDHRRRAQRDQEADYGPEYQAMVNRVGKLAKAGPLKTVWDPVKRVYKNVPVKESRIDLLRKIIQS